MLYHASMKSFFAGIAFIALFSISLFGAVLWFSNTMHHAPDCSLMSVQNLSCSKANTPKTWIVTHVAIFKNLFYAIEVFAVILIFWGMNPFLFFTATLCVTAWSFKMFIFRIHHSLFGYVQKIISWLALHELSPTIA